MRGDAYDPEVFSLGGWYFVKDMASFFIFRCSLGCQDGEFWFRCSNNTSTYYIIYDRDSAAPAPCSPCLQSPRRHRHPPRPFQTILHPAVGPPKGRPFHWKPRRRSQNTPCPAIWAFIATAWNGMVGRSPAGSLKTTSYSRNFWAAIGC